MSMFFNEMKNFLKDEFLRFYDFKNSVFCNEDCNFSDILRNYMGENSKLLRPLLTFLFSKLAFDKVTDEDIKIALAVEFLHNASLLHDDIIDEAKIRRNLPALHIKYDYNYGFVF